MKQIFPCFLLILLFHSIPSHSQRFIKESPSIAEFATLNDHTYFVARDPVHGKELWKTDGTAKGTVLVKDIYEGVLSSDPQNLFAYKGHIFFTANDGILGQELYKSDGTPEGTVLVKDIHTSPRQGSNATNFTVYNDLLYFSATNQYINGSYKIFSTDGTTGGTNLIYEGEENTYGNFTDLTVANQKLYFRSSMGNGLYELEASTNKVASIAVDEYYTVDELNSFNNELYFITNTSYRQDIRFYRINNEGELIRLKDFTAAQYGDIDIGNFAQVGKDVFFSMTIDNGSSQYSNELWKTNGSPEGTVIVKTYNWDRHMYGSNISNFTSYKGKLFFKGSSKDYHSLMESDGTSEGTKPVSKDRYIPVDYDTQFVHANDLLYFSSGLTIWSTDGTDVNTKQQTILRLARDSTGEEYYIKSDGEKVYFKARVEDENSLNYNRKILYTTEASSLLEVKTSSRKIENGSQINIESKIDSIVKVRITLKNTGSKSLLLSKIQVTGKDFYLNGKDLNNTTQEDYFPQQIDSKESAVFDLIFYPSGEGFQKGILTIYSNDTKNPEFSIDLKSYTEDTSISTNNSELVSLRKEIQFGPGGISLSSGIFSENLAKDSTIGTLSIPDSSDDYEYSFVNGEGDEDNASFKIVDNLLKTADSFDATYKNTLSIRILAKNKSTGNILEDAIILGLEAEPKEPFLETCPLTIEKLIFGLQDVDYISPNEVVAVGTQGVILKSYDGGQSWVKKYTRPTIRLSDLEFTNANTGYALGSNILLKTEDGGENWYQLDMPDKSYPYATNLVFIDAEVGFITGYESALYKTTDGGKNWRTIKNVPNYFTAGYFINESTGFMCGKSANTIVKTTNAGETWETIELNLTDSYYRTFVDLYFTDEQTGFLLSSNGDIAKTTDGGATWNLLQNDLYEPTSISFTSGSIGYITSASGLYKTEDAGETWTNIYNDHRLGPGAIAFSSDDRQAVMVGPGVYGESNGIAYRANAEDWKVISHFPTESYSISGFFEEAGFYFSEREARRTLDGGITWEMITKPEDYSFSQVELVGGNLYLLGNENLYKSTDLGENWSTVGNLESNSILHFINSEVIIAAGNTISRSVNGGVSWEPVSNDDYFHATDVSFIDNLKGAVAGLGGISLTQDGGKSWEKISIPLEEGYAFMYSVHFFNSSIGLAGSNNGIIYKSTDEGKTWSKTYTTIVGEIRFLYAKSALEWYAVDTAGSNSYLYKSTDGGESWVMITQFGSDMNQFHIVDDIIYTGGTLATLFKIFLADEPPGQPAQIEGDKLVMAGTTTSYSVFQETGQNFSWEVSGDHDLFFEENNAKITWDKPGNYTISVTPYSSCKSGTTRQIEITVQEKQHSDPVISGDVEVRQYSTNSYSVALRPDSKYEWFAEGAVTLTPDKNNVVIQWAEHGLGKVQVVETNIKSGIRYSAILGINITAVTEPKIKPTDITCRGKNNGSIYIETGSETTNFIAHLYIGDEGRTFEFNSQLNIENLGPGNYTLCLDRLTDNYRSCYEFEIKEPAQFEVKSQTSNVVKNQLDLTISGGVKPYRVFLNGDLIANTNQQQLSIQTTPGDYLEVFSSGDCTFSYEETIVSLSGLAVYPNPTRGEFSVELGQLSSSQEAISVRVYSSSGNLISTLSKEIKDGKILIDISQQSTGIYFLKIGDANTQTIKILKQ